MPAPNSAAVIALLTLLSALGPLAVQLYLPSLPSIAVALDASVPQVQLTVSGFMAGIGLSHLFYGPVSDRIGRRATLLGGVGLYLGAAVIATLAPNMPLMIAARVLQGVGAGAGAVVSRAVVRDVWGAEGAARVLAYITMMMSIAPVVAPAFGGWVEAGFGWRANFVLLTLFGGAMLLGVLFLLRETNEWQDVAAVRVAAVAWNYISLMRRGFYVGCFVTSAACVGGGFAFVAEAPFLLVSKLGFAQDQIGYAIGAMTSGVFFGSFFAARLAPRVGPVRLLVLGTAICAVAGLGAVTFVVTDKFSLAALIVPYFGMTFGAGIVMPMAMAVGIAPYPTMAGAASALLGFSAMTGNMAGIMLVGALRDGTPLPMTVVSAATSAGALVVALIVFGFRKTVR
jgi:DHA1 family bicyclomycin/chloramphenicol resistance-like MFS transporter